ncbi:MAG: oligosaccharide flippase family protein, partial [Lacipirellulaceae bacterium]
LLVVPVARVYLSEASRIAPHAPKELRDFFIRTLRKSALVGTPVIALLALSARVLFPWGLGQQWTEAGVYCQILCPLLLMHLFAVSIRPTFDVTHRQDLQFVAAAIGASLMLLGLFLPSYFLGDPLVTIAAMSAAGCLSHLISVSLSWYAIGHPRGAVS